MNMLQLHSYHIQFTKDNPDKGTETNEYATVTFLPYPVYKR